jgi:hypothetical protein
MEIEIFVLCKSADFPDDKLIIDKPLSMLEALRLPCSYSCKGVVRIRLDKSDSGTHTIQLSIISPTGESLKSTGGLFDTPDFSNPACIISSHTSIFPLPHIPLSNYGIHKAVLRIDGTISRKIPFVVTTLDGLPENPAVLNN